MADAKPFHWEYVPAPVTREVFRIQGLAALADDGPLPRDVVVRADDREFSMRARIDTPFEREVFVEGGILPFTLRRLAQRDRG